VDALRRTPEALEGHGWGLGGVPLESSSSSAPEELEGAIMKRLWLILLFPVLVLAGIALPFTRAAYGQWVGRACGPVGPAHPYIPVPEPEPERYEWTLTPTGSQLGLRRFDGQQWYQLGVLLIEDGAYYPLVGTGQWGARTEPPYPVPGAF